jgi:hypothetical protein
MGVSFRRHLLFEAGTRTASFTFRLRGLLELPTFPFFDLTPPAPPIPGLVEFGVEVTALKSRAAAISLRSAHVFV